MNTQQLLNVCKNSYTKFQFIINDNKIDNKTLFDMCTLDLNNYKEQEQRGIKYCFIVLFQVRLYDYITDVCEMKFNNMNMAEDFRDYVFDRLEKKLGTSFFPGFEEGKDFNQRLEKTLTRYIGKYYYIDFHKKRAKDNKLFQTFEDFHYEKIHGDSITSFLSDAKDHCENKKVTLEDFKTQVALFIINQYKNRATKKFLFIMFCNIRTDMVRELISDEKIHKITHKGKIEDNRKFDTTLNLLEQACHANLQKIKSKVKEVDKHYETLMAIFLKTMKISKELNELDKDELCMDTDRKSVV